MKHVKRILKIMFVLFISSFVFSKSSFAEPDYSYIDLDQLIEIQNNPEALAQVVTFEVIDEFQLEHEKIVNNIHLIELLPNVEYIIITANSLDLDKDFFESINTTKDFTLSLSTGSVDFKDAYNDKLVEIYLSENKVYNFESITNFINLEVIDTYNINGFKIANFNNLNKLNLLSIKCQNIENYKEFFTKSSNIKELDLTQSNITNSDMKYINKTTNLKGLYLEGTYVTDISFLKSIPSLENVGLPYDVDSFDVLYELPNLKSVWFDSLAEIKIVSNTELLNYFEQNNIEYTPFDRDIANKFNTLVESINILETDTDLEKIEKVKNFILNYMYIDGNYYETEYQTTIDNTINYHRGVCHDYSIISYTFLKAVGIDAYVVNGTAKNLFEGAENEYDRGGPHAWNVVHINNGWYGLDIMWTEDDDEEFHQRLENVFYLKSTYFDYSNEVYPYYHNQEEYNERYFALSHVTYNNPMDNVKTEYKLTYNPGENMSCNFDYIYSKSGEKWGKLCTLEKTGYTFKGWQTSGSTITENSIANANIVVTPKWEVIIPDIDEETGYTVEGNYIKGDFYNKLSNQIDLELDSIYHTVITNKSGAEKTTETMATGDEIKIYLGDEEAVVYKVILLGDPSGDGKINYLDYVGIYNHIKKSKHPELVNKVLLENEYLLAADMSGDNKVNYLDYVGIYNKIKELKGND